MSESTNYDVTCSFDPDPKSTQSKDKNCAKNHKGDILFINKTQKDVLLEWRDPVVGELSIVVRAGNQHLAQGLYTRDGLFSYRANLYRNIAKKENPESYSIFVEECVNSNESGSSSHLVKVGVWVVILKNGLSLPFAFQPRLRIT
ncbi:hypothetical protein [Runella salmonicolor]|uniref:Uncharacterized protein n=1 Tax=Runella salmonicolor TaxID=2950278 RepID=A0ABT1FWT9_9BACT|nr:hypothetical protein [Runella salmonicolor]MCP1386234.1 hypothetical protein [Runella salmonicolor]